jgi:hypothetical protein
MPKNGYPTIKIYKEESNFNKIASNNKDAYLPNKLTNYKSKTKNYKKTNPEEQTIKTITT